MSDDKSRAESIGVLLNNNSDQSVNPPTMVIGMMGKNAGAWNYLKGDSSGQLAVSAGDAGNFRVSAIGGTAGDRTLVDGTTQTISATLTPVSASPAGTVAGLVTNNQSYDAGKLLISAKQGDAGLLRISAIGGTAGDRTLVDGTTQTISATLTPISASPASTVQGLVTNSFQFDAGKQLVSAKQGDAGLLRVSAITALSANQQISALLLGGTAFVGDVSALSPDASLFRVSAIGGTAGDNTIVGGQDQTLSAAVQRVSGVISSGYNALLVYSQNRDDASNLRSSAFVDSGSISAKSSDAGTHLVSAKQGDAALLRVSAITALSANQQISALLLGGTANIGYVSAFVDNGSISAKSSDAATMRVSAINSISSLSPDAGLFRVSAQAFDYTTSAFMTAVGNSLSISALGSSVIGAQLSGTWTGTIAFQGTVDESNWFSTFGLDQSTMAIVSATTVSRNVVFDVGGLRRFRLSATAAMTGTLSAFLDASLANDNLIVAIKQEDAGNARLSALSQDAGLMLISAKQNDGSLFRVSAISVDATNLSVSAVQKDANILHTSAFVDSGSISAKSSDAGTNLVSAKSGDAGLLRISSIQGDAGLQLISAKSGDSAQLRVSAIVDNGSISAKSSDAGTLLISAKQGDAGLLLVSAKSATATNLPVSATQADAGLLRISSLWTTVGSGLTLFTSSFDTGSTGGVAVVNGAASKKIYIHAINLTLNAAGGVKWQSGATDLQGLNRLQASGGYMLATTPPAYVIATTSAGQDLNIGLSATGISASGWVAGWSA